MERESKVGLELLSEWFNRRRIKAVLFDMDSTLVNTTSHIKHAIDEYCGLLSQSFNLRLHGGKIVFTPKMVRSRFGEFYGEYKEVFGVDPFLTTHLAAFSTADEWLPRDDYIHLVNQLDRRVYEKSPEPYEGASDTIRLFDSIGVGCFIVTHADEQWTGMKIKRLGLEDLMKGRVVCIDVRKRKNTKTWLDAINILGLRPGRSMVVGDGWRADVGPMMGNINTAVLVGTGNIYQYPLNKEFNNLGRKLIYAPDISSVPEALLGSL